MAVDEFDNVFGNVTTEEEQTDKPTVVGGVLNVKGKNKKLIPFFPTSSINEIIDFCDNDDKYIKLIDIISELFSITDLYISQDVNRIYYKTIGLHGGQVPLHNAVYRTLEKDELNITVSGNIPSPDVFIMF